MKRKRQSNDQEHLPTEDASIGVAKLSAEQPRRFIGDGDETVLQDVEQLESALYQQKIGAESGVTTPSRRPGRPKRDPNGSIPHTTPRKGPVSKITLATPVKVDENFGDNDTPRIERNADRSARRKSTRLLIERTILGNASDNDEDEEEVAHNIYNSDEDGSIRNGEEVEDTSELVVLPDTPSRKRGRPKGSKNRRSPTPPLTDNLPYEKYFIQNRGGHVKTSNNNLAGLKLLDHEEYFGLTRKAKSSSTEKPNKLETSYLGLFSQWRFELTEDFNVCLYGFGSKRSLLLKFADYIYAHSDPTPPKIVIVNGYNSALTIRELLNTVGAAIAEPGGKLGSQPSEMVDNILALLEKGRHNNRMITLIIHSIDGVALRRPATQTILARLASHPQIRLLASADHPSFPLLWDSSLRSTFNFLFHECTTFQPYTAEIDVVDEVHELLGRSGRRIGGKEGVIFVLKSLPENAKNLFRVLVAEQLTTMDDSAPVQWNEDEDDEENQQRIGIIRKTEIGVEYRILYQKAVEEFICSNEMNLRILLKEFHDHQMIQSRKDSLGTEYLSVPFRKEELETILEDIS